MPDRSPVRYAEYLRLASLLNQQEPLSWQSRRPAHDELLFIIVHQVYELWFKQILHEINSIRVIFGNPTVDEPGIGVACHRAERIVQIQKLLLDQLTVLETMTPLDFLEFRDLLKPASGLESLQFRMLEVRLGLEERRRPEYGKTGVLAVLSPSEMRALARAKGEPSLFSLVEDWLERTPFLSVQGYHFWDQYRHAVQSRFRRDRTEVEHNKSLTPAEREKQLAESRSSERTFSALYDVGEYDRVRQEGHRRLSHRATQAALFILLYRDEPILHLPFRLLTDLIEIDEHLTAWRYRHALMVSRMIGRNIGTGGTSGYNYLRDTADQQRIFSDFATLATFLVPRSVIPPLPATIRKTLGFAYAPIRSSSTGRRKRR